MFKGQIPVRQRVVGIETLADGARKRCEIHLANEVVPTAPQPRRAFQGWRYFEAKDAPPDLAAGEGAELPQELARQLREIGAW